jgi:hypothetical protein
MKWFTQALDLNPNSGLEQFIHFLAKANLYFSITPSFSWGLLNELFFSNVLSGLNTNFIEFE